LGKGNVCVYVGKITEKTLHATNASAEECVVDDCEGELEENSKATFDINNHQCNVITDTEDDMGIIFKLDSNDLKVSSRDFGSYMKFNKECYQKRMQVWHGKHIPHCPAICSTCCGKKWHRLKCMNITGRYEKKILKANSYQF
jgi:hypothetical protein